MPCRPKPLIVVTARRRSAPRAGLPSAACLGLIVLGLAWEMWLAPLRPGGSGLGLKVLPLLRRCPGLFKNRMYTYRWVSLMVWLYFTEGVVRATGTTARQPAAGAALEMCALFVACAWHVSSPAPCGAARSRP
jgi:uncharacterized membrane protein